MPPYDVSAGPVGVILDSQFLNLGFVEEKVLVDHGDREELAID